MSEINHIFPIRYLPGVGENEGLVLVKTLKDIREDEQVLVHYMGGSAVKNSWSLGVCKCCNS